MEENVIFSDKTVNAVNPITKTIALNVKQKKKKRKVNGFARLFVSDRQNVCLQKYNRIIWRWNEK